MHNRWPTKIKAPICAAIWILICLFSVASCIDDPDEITTTTPLPPHAHDMSESDDDPPEDYEEAFSHSSVLSYSTPFSASPPIVNDSSGRIPGVPLRLASPYSVDDDGALRMAAADEGNDGGHASSQPDVDLPGYFIQYLGGDYDFTVEFFVHTGGMTFHGDMADAALVFSVAKPGSDSFLSAGFHQIDGEIHTQLRLPDQTLGDPLYVSSYDVYLDRHHHIAFVYHARYNDMTVYVDGHRVSSQAYHRYSTVAPPEPLDRLPYPLFGDFDAGNRLAVGNRPGPYDRYFSGAIYHLGFHDRAWDAAAVAEMNKLHRERFCGSEGC